MYCSNCNQDLEEVAKFCPDCGNKAESKPEQETTLETTATLSKSNESSGGNGGKIIWGLFVTIAGIVISVVSYNEAKDGGTYVVAYGAVIYGIITMIMGAVSDNS